MQSARILHHCPHLEKHCENDTSSISNMENVTLSQCLSVLVILNDADLPVINLNIKRVYSCRNDVAFKAFIRHKHASFQRLLYAVNCVLYQFKRKICVWTPGLQAKKNNIYI